LVKKHKYLLIAGAVLAILVFDLLVYLRPDFWSHNSEYQWRVLWHGKKSAAAGVFLLWSAVISLAFLAGKRISARLAGRKQDLFAASLIFALAVASPLVFSQVNQFGAHELLVRVFVKDHTGYFSDAVKFRGAENLARAYKHDLMSVSTHGRTHPPAAALIFSGLNRAGRSEALQGLYKALVNSGVRGRLEENFGVGVAEQTGGMLALWMMVLAGAISATLAYLLQRKFFTVDLCLVSGLALVSMPAFSAKTPVMDQVFAVFILAAALVSVAGEKGRIWQGLAAGFLVGTGIWLSPGVWSAMLLIPLMVIARDLGFAPRRKIQEVYESVMTVGLSAVLAAAFMVVAGSALLKVNYLDIFSINRMGWYINNVGSGRVHAWKWILFDPYEYFFWASVPIFAGFCVKLLAEIRELRIPLAFAKPDKFFFAAVAFAAILNASGQVCYESPRLCWFFLPIIANLSIAGIAHHTQNLHSRILGAFLILVTMQTVLVALIY